MEGDFARTDRVAGEIRRALAQIIGEELADPRVGMVSLTEVQLSKDLKHARIFVSALEMAGADALQSTEALNRAARFLRRELGRRLKTRSVPRLRFIADETERRAVALEDRIRSARAADQAAAQRRGEE